MGLPIKELRAVSRTHLSLSRSLLAAGLTANEAATHAILWEEAGFEPQTIKASPVLVAGVLGLDPRTVRTILGKLDERGVIDVLDKPDAKRSPWLLYVHDSADIDAPKRARKPDPQRFFPETDPEGFAQSPPGACAAVAQNPPGPAPGDAIVLACVRAARERDRQKISLFESSRSQLLPELLRQAACDLYRRLDPTSLPWVALSAIVAVEQGWLPGEIVDGQVRSAELDSLVDRCRGARNFGRRLRKAVGDQIWRGALKAGPLKEHLQDRHVRWDAARWETPPDPRRPTPAEVLFGVRERRASPVATPSRPASPAPDTDRIARLRAAVEAMTDDERMDVVTDGQSPQVAEGMRRMYRDAGDLLQEAALATLLEQAEQQPRAL